MSSAPRDFKRICVFCGAGVGTNPVYEQGARALGAEMVNRKIGLVYGGEVTSSAPAPSTPAPSRPAPNTQRRLDGLWVVSAFTRVGSSQAERWA